MPKPKFRRGYVAGWTEDERLFALRILKETGLTASKFEGMDRRMFQRLIMRFMGQPLHQFPLRPEAECPHCERTFAGMAIKGHIIRCKAEQIEQKRLPRVDQDVLDMLDEQT